MIWNLDLLFHAKKSALRHNLIAFLSNILRTTDDKPLRHLGIFQSNGGWEVRNTKPTSDEKMCGKKLIQLITNGLESINWGRQGLHCCLCSVSLQSKSLQPWSLAPCFVSLICTCLKSTSVLLVGTGAENTVLPGEVFLNYFPSC